MNIKDIRRIDAIHCETQSEFNRIIELFNMDAEYLFWDVYDEETVLFPYNNQYGVIDGYAADNNYNIIKSTDIS